MTDETREVIDAVKEMFFDLKSDIGRLEERLVKIEKTDIKRLEDRIIKIETTQENVTNKNIQLLGEGFESVTRKLDRLENVQDELANVQTDINIIKKVGTAHSIEINRLAKAK